MKVTMREIFFAIEELEIEQKRVLTNPTKDINESHHRIGCVVDLLKSIAKEMLPTQESRFCQALYLVNPHTKWWENYKTPYEAFEALPPLQKNDVLQIANWPTMKGMPSPGVGEDEPFFKAISRL